MAADYVFGSLNSSTYPRGYASGFNSPAASSATILISRSPARNGLQTDRMLRINAWERQRASARAWWCAGRRTWGRCNAGIGFHRRDASSFRPCTRCRGGPAEIRSRHAECCRSWRHSHRGLGTLSTEILPDRETGWETGAGKFFMAAAPPLKKSWYIPTHADTVGFFTLTQKGAPLL
jgi:hypothetical protein